MQQQITFIRFEIEERKHSPNAVIGFYNGRGDLTGAPIEKRVFIMAASTDLGKELGDKLAEQVKQDLERKYIGSAYLHEHAKIECPNCHHKQEHSFPMSGKLYCQGCGELLDQVE